MRAQGASGFIARGARAPRGMGRRAHGAAPQPEGAITRKYGDGRWVRIIERRTSEGGIIGIRFDVSDLKKQEQEIATKSALLEATLENISQGLSVFDENLRLSAFNRGFVDVFGLTDEVASVGTSFADFIRFNAKRRGLRRMRSSEQLAEKTGARPPEPHHVERRGPTGGSSRSSGGACRPAASSRPTRTSPATPRREAARRACPRARALERRARAVRLRRVARPAGAAADGRELLPAAGAALQGQARRATPTSSSASPSTARRACSADQRPARRTRASAGRGKELRPSTVTRVVRTARSPTSQAAIDESGARSTWDALPTVRGDEAQLRQLFQNLIGNAIKFRGDDARRRGRASAQPRRRGGWHLRGRATTASASSRSIFERIFLIFQRLHDRAGIPGHGHRPRHLQEDRRAPRRPDLGRVAARARARRSSSPLAAAPQQRRTRHEHASRKSDRSRSCSSRTIPATCG